MTTFISLNFILILLLFRSVVTLHTCMINEVEIGVGGLSKHCFVKRYPKIENYFSFLRKKVSKYCLTHHIVYDSIYVLFPKMYCQNILTKTCT